MIIAKDQPARVASTDADKARALLEDEFALMVEIDGQWQAKITGGFEMVADMLTVKGSLKVPSFVVVVR